MSSDYRGVLAGVLENLGIPDPDRTCLAMYLEGLKENSDNTFDGSAHAIFDFYNATNFKSITIMTLDDINAYIDFLKAQPWKETVKDGYQRRVKAWFHRAMKDFAARKIMITDWFAYVDNPFSARKAKKHADSMQITIDMDNKENIKALTDAELDTIINMSKLKAKWFQILLLILKYTGMRVSEAITIRLKNMDMKERVIGTGVVRNGRKSGKVLFFVPAHVATEIKSYTILLEKNEEWLFPAKISRNYMPRSTADSAILNFSRKISVKFSSHQFRHTLIKNREIKKHCPSHINEFLQNQEVTGTQAQFYRERNFTLRDRRDLYDLYNPYS
ncbi:MAG TPA: tyrosine-type recombinase/integrase [Candidatus Lokiarchaeia archaeon]|nr:tyrosine-type recombinase/integrase [Candidatus Lokiarchaeia archaeon]